MALSSGFPRSSMAPPWGRGDLQRLIRNLETSFTDGLTDAFGDAHCAVNVGLRQHNHEILAASTADAVGIAADGANQLADVAQHRVAGVMGEPVAGAHEMIQVRQRHTAKRAAAALTARQFR
jgi:hypothetical protein